MLPIQYYITILPFFYLFNMVSPIYVQLFLWLYKKKYTYILFKKFKKNIKVRLLKIKLIKFTKFNKILVNLSENNIKNIKKKTKSIKKWKNIKKIIKLQKINKTKKNPKKYYSFFINRLIYYLFYNIKKSKLFTFNTYYYNYDNLFKDKINSKVNIIYSYYFNYNNFYIQHNTDIQTIKYNYVSPSILISKTWDQNYKQVTKYMCYKHKRIYINLLKYIVKKNYTILKTKSSLIKKSSKFLEKYTWIHIDVDWDLNWYINNIEETFYIQEYNYNNLKKLGVYHLNKTASLSYYTDLKYMFNNMYFFLEFYNTQNYKLHQIFTKKNRIIFKRFFKLQKLRQSYFKKKKFLDQNSVLYKQNKEVFSEYNNPKDMIKQKKLQIIFYNKKKLPAKKKNLIYKKSTINLKGFFKKTLQFYLYKSKVYHKKYSKKYYNKKKNFKLTKKNWKIMIKKTISKLFFFRNKYKNFNYLKFTTLDSKLNNKNYTNTFYFNSRSILLKKKVKKLIFYYFFKKTKNSLTSSAYKFLTNFIYKNTNNTFKSKQLDKKYYNKFFNLNKSVLQPLRDTRRLEWSLLFKSKLNKRRYKLFFNKNVKTLSKKNYNNVFIYFYLRIFWHIFSWEQIKLLINTKLILINGSTKIPTNLVNGDILETFYGITTKILIIWYKFKYKKYLSRVKRWSYLNYRKIKTKRVAQKKKYPKIINKIPVELKHLQPLLIIDYSLSCAVFNKINSIFYKNLNNKIHLSTVYKLYLWKFKP